MEVTITKGTTTEMGIEVSSNEVTMIDDKVDKITDITITDTTTTITIAIAADTTLITTLITTMVMVGMSIKLLIRAAMALRTM
jgi:hypothetical protein